MNIKQIINDTIEQTLKSKICPVCNNKLTYKMIFRPNFSKYTIPLLKETIIYDDCLAVSTIFSMTRIHLANGLQLVQKHEELYMPFAFTNHNDNFPIDDLNANDFQDLYIKLNKIITFQ